MKVQNSFISKTCSLIECRSKACDPRFDLINRGAFGLKRMFDDCGMILTADDDEPLLQPFRDPRGATAKKPSYKSREVLPNVRDFINLSGGTSKNGSDIGAQENGSANGNGRIESSSVKNLLVATRKVSQEFVDLDVNEESRKVRYIANQVKFKWLQVVNMHERFTTTELTYVETSLHYC